MAENRMSQMFPLVIMVEKDTGLYLHTPLSLHSARTKPPFQTEDNYNFTFADNLLVAESLLFPFLFH